MKIVIILSFLYFIFSVTEAQPIPPTTWPPTWYTWVVTSVVQIGNDRPLYTYGQLIAFDTLTNIACRFSQQNLLTPVPNRPIDVCDYNVGAHFMMDDTKEHSPCVGKPPLQGPLGRIIYPPQYLAVARFLGVDKVAQKDCNHFVAMNIVIDGDNIQMDVWTAVDNQYPCQISITDLPTKTVTTWAFDGFSNFIPGPSQAQCTAPELICSQEDWKCLPKPEATNGQLGEALDWVCDPSHLNCGPIQPGGEFYYPNTPRDHCNWAFNAYYRKNRSIQGRFACDFRGISEIYPPSNNTITVEQTEVTFNKLVKVYSNNIVCERS